MNHKQALDALAVQERDQLRADAFQLKAAVERPLSQIPVLSLATAFGLGTAAGVLSASPASSARRGMLGRLISPIQTLGRLGLFRLVALDTQE